MIGRKCWLGVHWLYIIIYVYTLKTTYIHYINSPPPTIKHPTKTPTPYPKHNPSIKHTSNIIIPAIICKDYEVGSSRYGGWWCGIFSKSKVRYIEWAVSGPFHFFLVARRLPRLIEVLVASSMFWVVFRLFWGLKSLFYPFPTSQSKECGHYHYKFGYQVGSAIRPGSLL